jgi:PAS domain S-box-containing protein
MVYDKQGRPHWILWQDTPGPAGTLIGVGSDVTERVQMQEALRRSEEKYRSLAEHSAQGIAIFQNARLVFVNPSMCQMLGYSAEELMSLSTAQLLDTVHPADRPQAVARAQKLMAGHVVAHRSEYRTLRKDGSVRWLESFITPIDYEGRPAYLSTTLDITERVQAEEALRNSEAILRTAVESMPFNFWATDEDGRYVMQNSVSLARWGSVIGKRPEETDLPEDMVRGWLATNRRAFGGEVVQEEVERVTDGQRIVEYKTVAPIRDGDRIRGVLGVTIDITDRVRAEEALRQAQKTESLGVLAGGIAHDFNNLLVAMLGQASLALAQLPPESPARSPIEKAVKAAERGADLARQMLAYSGRGQFERRPIQLNILIHENLHLFEVAVPKNVQLRMELAETLPPIEGDIGQMQQVVMNLIINAAEAIGERPGTVRVITGVEDVRAGDDRLWRYTDQPLAPGRYVTLEVRDNGSGMDAETLSKIFDPFFTTKFTGRGLGLAAVLGIVRGHKGGLLVDSAPGRGTAFKLFFPAGSSEAIQPLPPDAAPRAYAPASGLILVIDDEQPVREAVTDILELDGLQVITAPGGAAGLALYQERQADVRLVLLDLSMPGMGGEETFRRLRAINPDVRVLLSSGYSQAEATRQFVGQGLAGFIQKPYDAGTLVRTIRQHLAE